MNEDLILTFEEYTEHKNNNGNRTSQEILSLMLIKELRELNLHLSNIDTAMWRGN